MSRTNTPTCDSFASGNALIDFPPLLQPILVSLNDRVNDTGPNKAVDAREDTSLVTDAAMQQVHYHMLSDAASYTALVPFHSSTSKIRRSP